MRLCFFVFVAFIGLSNKALAHATLLRSTPAARDVLTTSPPQFRLVFSEQLVGDMSSIDVISANSSVTRLKTSVDPRDVYALIADAPQLAPGAYRVKWRIVSADGHPISGSFVFTIADSSAPDAVAPQADTVAVHSDFPRDPGLGHEMNAEPMFAGAALIPSALRAIAMICLMSLAGLLAVTRWSDAADSNLSRVTNWIAIAAPLALLAHLAAWLSHVGGSPAASQFTMTTALGSSVGKPEVARVVLALLAAWALFLARRRTMATVLAIAAVAVGGAIGHPAAFSPLISIPAKSLHLVAASLWLGGLLTIVLADREKRETFVAQTQRASAVAMAAVAVVTLSGIVQSVLFLDGPSDLTTSPYGRLVLVKIAGVIGLLALGAYHRIRLLPQLLAVGNPGKLKSSVSRETALMLAVIVVGAFMAYVPTPPAETEISSSQTQVEEE